VWTLAAWCELREDVRSFRVDRMAVVQVQGERFADEPGKTLADLLRRLRERKPEPPGEAN
jgi:predicted DNA-binding transcriptional regulator YafY